MKRNELIEHLIKGERWFNNGSKRSRQVTDIDAIFVYYLSNNGRTITGILIDRFATWAKGTGIVEKK